MKKEIVKISIIFFVVVGIILFGLNTIFHQGAQKSKATGQTITLAFNPTSATPTANQDFTVTLHMTPSVDTALRGYRTGITFDKSVVHFKSIQYKLGVVSTGLGNVDADATTVNAAGVLNLVAEDQTATGTTVTAATGADIATITFTALSANPTSILNSNSVFFSINSDKSLSSAWGYVPANLKVNGGVSTCTSFSDNFSGTSIDSSKWSFNNPSSKGNVTVANGVGQLTIPTSTNSATLWDGLDTKVSGDFTAELTSESIVTTNNLNTGGISFNFNSTSNKSFRIGRNYNPSSIFWIVNNSDSDWNNFQSKSINIGASNNTPVKIKLVRTGTTVYMYYDVLDGKGYQLLNQFDGFSASTDGWIQVEDSNWGPGYPASTTTFTNFALTCPASTVPGNVRLNLKLKFQGITALPSSNNSMVVTGKLLNSASGSQVVTGTGTFTAGANGIWTGTIGFNIPNLSGTFTLLVSGDKSMAKKICVSNPTESTPGTYHCSTGSIVLAAGDNNFDLSNIIILQGDLNQDGIVDSVDFGTVKNLLGKTDATSVSKADINHDGRVDTQDISLIINALSFKIADSF